MKRIGEFPLPIPPEDGPRRSAAEDSGALAPASPPCPICKGMGWLVLDVEPGHPDFGNTVPCRCTQARIAGERMRELRTVSNLGALERMTFDTFMPDGVGVPEGVRRALREAFSLSQAYASEPRGWLVLLGGYGAGKTHLAAAIANHRIALGHPAVFVVVPDLLDYLRATYAPGSASGLDQRLEEIKETPLLILDDLGSHNATPWAQEKLFQILNFRYNNRLPTVVTTNQRLDDLDPRIASRLAEFDLSQVFEIPAPDFRSGHSGIMPAERSGRNLSTLDLHSDQTFDTFLQRPDLSASEQKNLRDALDAARRYADDPRGWVVFSGVYGSGKTHLAAAIANDWLASGRPSPMFVVVPDLLDHLRATFSPQSNVTMDRLFEQVRTAPLLVLDSLETESATPWAREKLFQLLNHRYAARLPTVITTFSEVEKLDPRLASRLLDPSRCRVIGLIAPRYRGGGQPGRPPAKPRTK